MTKSDLSRPDRTTPDAFEDIAFDLRDALAALFRHIRPALLILAAAILGAGIYLLLTPAEYTADAKLIIRLGREKSAAPIQSGANQNYMFSERAQNVNNEIEILRDPSIVRDEFAALKAITPAGDLGPPPEDFMDWLIYQGRVAMRGAKAVKTWIVDIARIPFEALGLLRHLSPDEKLYEAYLASFKVVFVKETDVILTGFTWTDPNFAAQALNRLLDAYKRRHVEVYADETPATFYQGKLERARADLAAIDAQLAKSLKGNNTASFEIEQQNDLGTLSDLARQKSAAQIEREGVEARLKRTRETGPDRWQPTPPDADPTVAAFDTRWADLRTKRAEIAVRFRPTAPEFVSLDRDLAALTRQKYQALIAADTARLSVLSEKIQTITGIEANRRRAAIGQSDAALAYGRLAQQKSLLSDEITDTQKRIDALRTGTGLDAQSVTSSALVARAVPPRLPSGPNRPLILGLAAGLGLLAALAYVALAEILAQTYRSASEVARSLRVPVLAAVPLRSGPGRRPRFGGTAA
ncbi:Wzz/FepE/Etk N-terminal domain-containing protein [Methylobacterium sp. J-001]|uniref:Wzz/FepE/Etk N-terminal domain-containing protein n=1 Tax=Methylobacterium sp. J-001 TaxID=2836609 RepID=UPI001FBB0D56|nr:Wzz/FepE/Etk N-terminal domain-containing protein [Methylobacterium sp. J-001]MCJ2120015.1 Wzz/FepE/Etk N-terminal domain-containing protein [Methylobacterium sp. J-001]